MPEVDRAKRCVNHFANVVQIEFRDDSACIRVTLKQFTVLQNGSQVLITNMWYLLLCVVLLNRSQVFKGGLSDA